MQRPCPRKSGHQCSWGRGGRDREVGVGQPRLRGDQEGPYRPRADLVFCFVLFFSPPKHPGTFEEFPQGNGKQSRAPGGPQIIWLSVKPQPWSSKSRSGLHDSGHPHHTPGRAGRYQTQAQGHSQWQRGLPILGKGEPRLTERKNILRVTRAVGHDGTQRAMVMAVNS